MLIGHKTQWNFLKRLAKTGRIPQALLFTGEEKLGKRKVAIEFIKLLNGDIEKGVHPDVYILTPQKKASSPGPGTAHREIQIGQIRDLQNFLNLRPWRASFKSIIIDDAHLMNTEAQNCLLKSLEEPKGKVVFLLISSHPQMLAETIRSRTQLLKFYPLSPSQLQKYLQERGVPSEQIRKLLRFSQGKPGKMIEFLDSPQALENEIQAYSQVERILTSSLPQRFWQIKKIFSEKKISPENFLENLLRCQRELLLRSLKDSELQSNYNLSFLKKMIEITEQLKLTISSSTVNPQLAIENLMITDSFLQYYDSTNH